MPRPSKRRTDTANRLRAEHRREHKEHQAWCADLERWREEYTRAAVAYLSRAAPELEIESYEAALESHEVAIEAHEEMVDRHDLMLAAEARGGPVTSDEMARFQSEIEDRHDRSREKHKLLEIAHRAILQALRMMTSDHQP